ncbi:hypothetical protein [Echinicola sp. 20G]|uniref:hypothetical protein n=1 Tax=Echinicola sp. 20G TaxID=2781961 RepID=UPI00191057F4|nr:hypothetical protein [Echinicola sp. 20G]
MTDKVKFREPFIHPESFCFYVSSDNPEFGEIYLDIGDSEITVFTDFDHSHYPLHWVDEEKSKDIQRHKIIGIALESIKDIIRGNVMIELEKKGDKIIKAYSYHKDQPDNKLSFVLTLEPGGEKLTNSDSTMPLERVTVNWHGLVKKEKLLVPVKTESQTGIFRKIKSWFSK